MSKSEVHLFTISSIVFPLSIDGGGTEIATDAPAGCAREEAPMKTRVERTFGMVP